MSSIEASRDFQRRDCSQLGVSYYAINSHWRYWFLEISWRAGDVMSRNWNVLDSITPTIREKNNDSDRRDYLIEGQIRQKNENLHTGLFRGVDDGIDIRFFPNVGNRPIWRHRKTDVFRKSLLLKDTIRMGSREYQNAIWHRKIHQVVSFSFSGTLPNTENPGPAGTYKNIQRTFSMPVTSLFAMKLCWQLTTGSLHISSKFR